MDGNFVLYDGECPACRMYMGIARLRELYPDLRIIDARAAPELVAEVRRQGFEVNDGMMVKLGETIHFGAEATRVIAEMGAKHEVRSRRVALAFFGTAPWSRALYPWLNRGRQLLLRLLGRKLIG
jgi:predicted DCC family thiol-disulfide oxidoreductase YuxK